MRLPHYIPPPQLFPPLRFVQKFRHGQRILLQAPPSTTFIPDVQLQEAYLHLVEMAVTGSLTDEAGTCNGGPGGCALANVKPYDASERENGNDWPPFGHTMVGHKRLWNVNMTLRTVFANNVPGDFVELGVWRGGVCIYAKAMINMFAQKNREVHVFDAFSKIPGYKGAQDFLMNSEESVKHNFVKYGVMDNQVVFHVGLFKDTLPALASRKRSLLGRSLCCA